MIESAVQYFEPVQEYKLNPANQSVRSGILKDVATQKWVDVKVVRDLTPSRVDSAEKIWKPERLHLSACRSSQGKQPEHAHWDWKGKTNPFWASQWRFTAVFFKETCEGLMAVRTKPRPSRLTKKPVLYVDFVEVAPWNSRDLTDTPRFSGVGTLLVIDGIKMSLDAGWKGRIGLSALSQAKGFYTRLGMIMIEEGDAEYGDLAYFEFDEQSVEKLIDQL